MSSHDAAGPCHKTRFLCPPQHCVCVLPSPQGLCVLLWLESALIPMLSFDCCFCSANIPAFVIMFNVLLGNFCYSIRLILPDILKKIDTNWKKSEARSVWSNVWCTNGCACVCASTCSVTKLRYPLHGCRCCAVYATPRLAHLLEARWLLCR